MAAAGGLSLLPLSAVALGGLLAIDTFLDNRMKKAALHWLGVRSEQDSKVWLQRICILTNVAILGIGFFVNRPEALATCAVGFAVDTAEASTKYNLDQQNARLVEDDRARETSKGRIDELFGDASFQMGAITSLYEMLTDLQKSTAQATTRIFRS